MSIIRKAEAACSKCGAKNETTIYRSINTADNPELKQKVRDGSLFLWRCSSCGQTNLARYETLYHDPEKKVMIWLLPEGLEVSEAQMQSISLHAKAIGDYTLRRTDDAGSLMEKVLIFDAGLDDIVIEMCKFVTRMELISKAGDKDRAEKISRAAFHFYSLTGEDESAVLTLTYPDPDAGKITGVNIGWNVYEDCMGILSRNPGIRPGDGFQKIDAAWLESRIR